MTAAETPSAGEINPATVVIDGRQLTLNDVARVARENARATLTLDRAIRSRITTGFDRLNDLIDSGSPIYGVTTGFGASANCRIGSEKAALLQRRLVDFLGNGTGRNLPIEAVRAVILIRANNLARGYSGVRVALIERLLEFLNAGITPVIPEEGSVGASGDLVPLSYLAASLLGQRDVHFHGEVVTAAHAHKAVCMTPLVLGPKEGLSVVNGTAFMTGIAALACLDAKRLAVVADVCTALAVEVLRGITTSFDQFLHDIAKPHAGQVRSAANIRDMLMDSRLGRPYEDVIEELTSVGDNAGSRDTRLQDMYSIRCAPHYIGVLWDVLDWVEQWLSIEINASTDNPLVDPSSGQIFSGGNFSGGHVALAMDTLKAAVSSIADLLDRQLQLVVDEKYNGGLGANLVPPCPVGHPEFGINHGFKGMQLACSSLTADALSRGMPLSAFSRSTECHNQDKVSMGATAARQARDVIEIVERVAAIHLLALCQAADLRGAGGLGRTAGIYRNIRAKVPFLSHDRPMAGDIAAVVNMIHDGTFLAGANLCPE